MKSTYDNLDGGYRRCADDVDAQLESYASHPRFCGIRHIVQDEPDDDYMLAPDFQRGIGRLKAHGMTYDVLVFPKQLPAAIGLVQAFPEQPFVLDHIAKPFIKKGEIEPWKRHIAALAERPNVACKVSGMVTEANWEEWKKDDFHPYLDVVFEAFGEDRLIFGSDWPHPEGVREPLDFLDEVDGLAAPVVRRIMRDNSADLFGLAT